MRLRPLLSIAAVLAFTVSIPLASWAEELSIDAKLLDPAAAAKPKAKKGKQQQAAAKPEGGGKSDKSGKPENRQFGELEGWSPGKAPPKKKEEEKDSRFGSKAPVSMSPSGGMAVGMPF